MFSPSCVIRAPIIAETIDATTRSIVRPLQEAVASGDLTGTVLVSCTDETGALVQSLKDRNDRNDSLINTIVRLRNGTDTTALAAREIASGNADLSSRTGSQPGRNLAQRSAAAAREIKGLIVDPVDKVDTGSKLVDTAGQTMQEIVSSMRQAAAGSLQDQAAEQIRAIAIFPLPGGRKAPPPAQRILT